MVRRKLSDLLINPGIAILVQRCDRSAYEEIVGDCGQRREIFTVFYPVLLRIVAAARKKKNVTCGKIWLLQQNIRLIYNLSSRKTR